MSDPTSAAVLIGSITGIVGAITGIAGMVLGYLGYKTSKSMKSLDLRLELRKSLSKILSSLSQLSTLIKSADESRKAVASATGRFKSGMMELWKQQVGADTKALNQLFTSASAAGDHFDNLTSKELESNLVDLHRLQLQADEMKERYDAAVRDDDEARKRIRDDARARHTPKN